MNISPYAHTTANVERRASGAVVVRRSDSEEHWTEYRSVQDQIADLEWTAANFAKQRQDTLSELRWMLEHDVRQWQGVNRPVLLTKLAEVERLRQRARYLRNTGRVYAEQARELRAAQAPQPMAAE